MALKSVVFLRNKRSANAVLEAFADGLQEAFGRMGLLTASYDFEEYETGACIPKILAQSPDCTIGFNILLPEDSPLRVPHYAPLCDSATYYPELRLTNHLIASFMEQDSFGFYKKLGVQNIFFLPHAIAAKYLSEKQQKRDLDVVVAGSFVNPDVIRKVWQEQLSPKAQQAMLDIAEKVLASPHLSHLQAFLELIEEHGAFEKELLAKKLDFFSQINMLEVYIRNTDRKRLLENIKDHTIHIFTSKEYREAWKFALSGKSNIVFHDNVPFHELPAIFSRARAVVNSMPTIKRGLHERLLLALASGASVLGSDNIFIAKEFNEPKALVTLLSPDYTNVNDLLHNAFQDEDDRVKAVLATHKTIKNAHTWDVRAKNLAAVLPPIIKSL